MPTASALRSSFNGTLLSPRRIGNVNRSLVLQALCDHGPLSRADLARMAGVTRATIGNIVQDLLDAGLVEELEPRAGGGRVGKPARPVWFAERAGLCGAAALGVGTLEVALVSARGELLAREELEFDSDAPDHRSAAAAIVKGLKRVLPGGDEEILGIGIAVPGACDTATGTVVGSGQLPGLRGTGLFEHVAAKLGATVLVDNDARAQALGEKWFGDGRGVASFASVQTGHGLGVGLVIDGSIFRGRDGETGELGHTRVDLGGERCRCGLSGCWETVATLRWLRREAGARGLPGARALDAERLVRLAADDARARDLLEHYADNLAVGLANLIQVLNPERVILHGDAARAGEPFRALVADRIAASVFPYLADGIDLVLSSLDQQAGLLGAAGLVLSETFSLG